MHFIFDVGDFKFACQKAISPICININLCQDI